MLFVHSQLLPKSHSKILTLGEKPSKIQFFTRGSKQRYKLKIEPYLSTRVQGYAQIPKQSPNVKILIFYANWDNSIYLEKCDFQQKLDCELWDYR